MRACERLSFFRCDQHFKFSLRLFAIYFIGRGSKDNNYTIMSSFVFSFSFWGERVL